MGNLTQLSKLLSFVLRHRPDAYGVHLDREGWADVAELLAAFEQRGVAIDLDVLRAIVSSDDKQRYAFSDGERSVRAQQGHSLSVALGYEEAVPPALLFHGTVERFLTRISVQGLLRGQRQHVHLSASREAAERVGARRGLAIVLEIRAAELSASGSVFFRTPNDVWLTEHVPPGYLVIPTSVTES